MLILYLINILVNEVYLYEITLHMYIELFNHYIFSYYSFLQTYNIE